MKFWVEANIVVCQNGYLLFDALLSFFVYREPRLPSYLEGGEYVVFFWPYVVFTISYCHG